MKCFSYITDDLVSQVKNKVQWNYHALESIVLEQDEAGKKIFHYSS